MMASPLQQTKDWVVQHKRWVALLMVAAFGYMFGKDMALHDNTADAVRAGENA